MILEAAAAYMMHLLRSGSTAGHGVHSPFMFRFITEVLGGSTDKAITREVENLRREMLADTRVIRVRDLGAGSAVMKGEERSIRRIVSAAALPARDAALLARVAGNLDMISEREMRAVVLPGSHSGEGFRNDTEREEGQKPKRDQGMQMHNVREQGTGIQPGHEQVTGNQPGKVILELGTSLGISTLAMALAAPDRRVISVEGSPELAAIASENLRNHGASNAEVICMEFSEALRYLADTGIKVEMAFIDGNHRGKALAEYVETIRRMGEEMIMVADDIRMNSDMSRAWKTLSGDGKSGLDDGNKHGETRPQMLIKNTTGTHAGQPTWTDINSYHQRESHSVMHRDNGTLSSPDFQSAPVSLETFRMGMLFFLHNITPGHYRVRC
ncbi:MAG: hypothetical protein EP313_03200 [Bacteroidetes bacterium]|nr:MAG: hypothetical protein EP313_03200 [Bacteroidota bacterium]